MLETAPIKWGPKNATITSLDLSTLVNQVVSRSDWAPGKVVTFALVTEQPTPTWWFGFEDSKAGLGHPPSLKLVYR